MNHVTHACLGTHNPTPSGAGALFDPTPALAFLEALGKDPAACRVRAFAHKNNPRRDAIGARKGQGIHAGELNRWQREGRGLYVVINDGGDTKGSITRCLAFFVEWDDRPLEWQLEAWQELGLPEPSLMVSTGGKSVHCYWVLAEPIPPEQWAPLQTRLIDHCGGDTACKDASRVMRLPGASYMGPDSQPTGQRVEILHQSAHRYGVGELAACLPEPTPPAPVAAAGAAAAKVRTLRPRPLAEIEAAAEYIPARVGGEGTYEQDRNALCGCAAALEEIGMPEAVALDLLGHKWPSRGAAEQLLRSTTTRNAAAFWAIAGEHGYNLRLPVEVTAAAAKDAPKRDSRRWADRNRRRLGHTRNLWLFDRAVAHLAQRCRNTLTRRARLLRIAKALGLSAEINRQEISQRVLEAKDRQQGHHFHPLTAADRLAMDRPMVRWLVPGLIPAGDLTIIGGRPKVGKTRLAVALAAAVLNGSELLGFGAASQRPVLLVTDDQSDGDSADMLEALGLWTHPRLVWSRHFRLNEGDMDRLLEAIKAHPEALVILDSLRSISRSLDAKENDPEIGAALYDLKAAVIEAGGTLALVHHCNKGEGLIGTEALSGHNAIAGAANTVLTLHYVPGADGKPIKDAPQRRLVREARSGEGFDLVISHTAGGAGFHRVGTFADWQQKAQQGAEEIKRLERLTPYQDTLLGAVEDADGAFLTRRDVCELLGVAWGDGGRNREAARVGEALRALVAKGLIEAVRTGKESSYRSLSRSALETFPTIPTNSGTKGSQGI